jgi:uncharacterized protein (DUF169 family)
MTNKEFNAIIEQYLRPQTFPVAIKFSEADEIPIECKRPMKVLNHRINICQGVGLARRHGWSLGFCAEDMGCSVSMSIFGFCEEPDFVQRGEIIYPGFTKTLEAAKRMQIMQPRAPLNSFKSIWIGPLSRVDFEPDIVLVYGSPAQIIRLVQAALYHEGGYIESRFSGRCACAQEFIYPYFSQNCNVVIPAQGERVFAITTDEEVTFSIPRNKIAYVAEGLEETHKSGAARFPTPYFGTQTHPIFPKRYEEMERFCGIRPPATTE